MLRTRQFDPSTHQVSTFPLTQVLIAWDFHTDVVDDRSSTPEHENILLQRALNRSRVGVEDLQLKELRPKYRDVEDYISHYFPLFVIETKQSMHRAKEMDMSANSGERVFQQSLVQKNESAFLISVTRNSAVGGYGPGDLVLLYRRPPPPSCPHLQANFAERCKAAFSKSAEKSNQSEISAEKPEEKATRGEDNATDGEGAGENELVGGTGDEGKVTAEEAGEFLESKEPSTPLTVEAEKKGKAEGGTATAAEENEEDDEAEKPFSPLIDNPHHVMGVVEGVSRGVVTIRVIIRDCTLTVEQLLALTTSNSKTPTTPGPGGAAGAASTEDAASMAEGDVDEAALAEATKKASLKARMNVEFMLERERYRMEYMVDAVTLKRNETWFLAKIMNLTTSYREYQALMSVPECALLKSVISTSAADKKREEKKRRQKNLENEREEGEGEGKGSEEGSGAKEVFSIPAKLEETLEAMYNESQMGALRDCLKVQGITAIQGPPGTGKTTTIVGILSVILNASYKQTEDYAAKAVMEAWAVNKRRRRSAGPELNATIEKAQSDEGRTTRMRKQTQPWIYDDAYQCWFDVKACEDVEEVEDETPIERAGDDIVNAVAVCAQANSSAELPRSRTRINLSEKSAMEAPQRLLVCAPSNAAIDEILRRLTADPRKNGGIFDAEGQRYNPQVVRVGPNTHPELSRFSLQHRVKGRMEALAGGAKGAASEEGLKVAILGDARVVCATLSVAGSQDLTGFAGGFDTVVVDEASQAVELSTLIPLKLMCKRLILVGDPRQLPATVFSKVALELKYDQSLFQRLERAGTKINMLSVQYRMHPLIAKFPSDAFYDGALKNWDGVLKACVPPLPYYDLPIFKPCVLFSLDSADSVSGTSRVNRDEADFIVQLVDLLRMLFAQLPEYQWTDKIAVISPYLEQVKLCEKLLKALLGVDPTLPCPIDVGTVDGFQGREKDLVIFSAVRSQLVGDTSVKKARVGFLADRRRMNVALTRARLNMWVVGNGRYLAANPEWGKYVQHCSTTQSIFTVAYERYSRDGFLKYWLLDYCSRMPAAQRFFDTHAPHVLDRVKRDVQFLTQAEQHKRALQKAQEEKQKDWA